MPNAVVLIALAGVLLFAALSPAAAQTPGGSPPRGLGHTMECLEKRRALRVGYFGGSITEGAGASKPAETSWRARTTAYLRKTYPDTQITEINAAIGGTGSDLGAFRIGDDLLSKKPDLVFVEFAVNDGTAAEETALRSIEGIVRRIRRDAPRADIVFVYTTSKALAPPYEKGELPAAVRYHQRVADHYRIPWVNVGEALAREVREKHGGDWQALTTDGVHPNDTGYERYAATVTAFLEARRKDQTEAPPALPAPLTAAPLENGSLVDAWSLPESPGWTREAQSLSGRYPHRLSATAPGSELTLRFNGDAVGLYWLIAPDSGDIEWQIDGGPWKRRSSWDKYALRFTRANYTVLDSHLTPGPHELRLRVLAEKNGESTGTAVRIGAFLVNGPTALDRAD